MKVPKLSQLVMDQLLFDSSISLISLQALMRFDFRRLAEQRKKKLESSDPPPMKKGKEKDVTASTSTSPRFALASIAGALLINAIDISQAFIWDTATLDKDLLYTMMPQHDLHTCKRNLGLDELLNQDFNSILNAASYFRLFAEHIEWLDENKKSLKEALQSAKVCQKVVEEKAAKEEKPT
ncbi:hypothetical protein COCNU_08G006360 [Cocos nucifera]|uniref:Uncharacterized protein n=1 Tax=Cocos nucifera TaxID=13894 RepID=A0A8K0N6A6_COCNU|nr:hypothetical protein COCNU_08G006360 [Cocos nucifera]